VKTLILYPVTSRKFVTRDCIADDQHPGGGEGGGVLSMVLTGNIKYSIEDYSMGVRGQVHQGDEVGEERGHLTFVGPRRGTVLQMIHTRGLTLSMEYRRMPSVVRDRGATSFMSLLRLEPVNIVGGHTEVCLPLLPYMGHVGASFFAS